MRLTTGSSAVAGRSERMRSTASLTSSTAVCVSTSRRNSTTVCERPSVSVEMTFLTPQILATASSTRLVTCVSSSLGATPGSVIVTDTSGTSMLGKRVTGSFEKLASPSATRTMNSRMAGSGLRIDQAEKFQFMALPLPSARRAPGSTRSPSATKVPARNTTSVPACEPRGDLDEAAGAQRPASPARSSPGRRRRSAGRLRAPVDHRGRRHREALAPGESRSRPAQNCRPAPPNRAPARCGWRRAGRPHRPPERSAGCCPRRHWLRRPARSLPACPAAAAAATSPRRRRPARTRRRWRS